MTRSTRTGGREATKGVIPGRYALSVGKPDLGEPEGFQWRQLTDLARLESGHTPSKTKCEYWDGVIPWIGVRDATGHHGEVITTTIATVTQAGLDNSSARLLPEGTVCLSRTASVGYVVEMGVPMATSQDFVNWVCGPEISAPYLRYLLMLEQESVRRFAHGTTHQTMYYPEAKALHVLVPSRSQQDAIAEVLGALDDKIAANDRVIQLCDELSAMHFRRALDRGGVSVPLSSLARFVNGRAYTRNATGTGRVVIRIAELNSGLGRSTVYNDIDVPVDHLARPGDLLFAWSGSLTVARWYRPEAVVNQHIFKVIPGDGVPVWLANQALHARLDEFRAIAADKTTTMGHIQRRHLDEGAAVPSTHEVQRIDELMTSLWNRALSAEMENLKLARTRDELLPLLMAGKVRITDLGATYGTIG